MHPNRTHLPVQSLAAAIAVAVYPGVNGMSQPRHDGLVQVPLLSTWAQENPLWLPFAQAWHAIPEAAQAYPDADAAQLRNIHYNPQFAFQAELAQSQPGKLEAGLLGQAHDFNAPLTYAGNPPEIADGFAWPPGLLSRLSAFRAGCEAEAPLNPTQNAYPVIAHKPAT